MAGIANIHLLWILRTMVEVQLWMSRNDVSWFFLCKKTNSALLSFNVFWISRALNPLFSKHCWPIVSMFYSLYRKKNNVNEIWFRWLSFFSQISQFKQFMFYLDDAEQITISDTENILNSLRIITTTVEQTGRASTHTFI